MIVTRNVKKGFNKAKCKQTVCLLFIVIDFLETIRKGIGVLGGLKPMSHAHNGNGGDSGPQAVILYSV